MHHMKLTIIKGVHIAQVAIKLPEFTSCFLPIIDLET